ncbi:hypothetical protein [Streptomyces sp. PTD5-9]|uniref:hypothetical protein n=1 Tax=Streptomyces sp. PTD5-9 TaxID=3120150 RepID=UPI00300B9DF6
MTQMPKYARLTAGTHDDPHQAVVDITVIENGLGNGGAQPIAWADITGKPSTYPPAAHTHTAADLTDATTTGRSVLTATDQAAARTAIGAGTSSLTLGTTATTAAAGTHTHTATSTTATAIGPGTATNVQGILAELAARIAALETP